MKPKISVFDYRVPDGMIAITFDVKGTNPSTIAFNAEDAISIENFVNTARTLNYAQAIVFIAQTLRKIRKISKTETIDANQLRSSVAFLGYWTCVNHPQVGTHFRQTLSDLLARKGKAHISWHLSKTKSFAFAVGTQFMDLEAATNAMPENHIVLASINPPQPKTTH